MKRNSKKEAGKIPLVPMAGRVIVLPMRAEKRSPSGIVIPETVSKEKPETGKVVAVGAGKVLEDGSRAEVEMKVGDTVLFAKYSPEEIKIDGVEYYVLSQDNVLAIIK